MLNITQIVKKTTHFIRSEVWQLPLSTLSRRHAFLVKQLRIILLSIRKFGTDMCMLRASALTVYSLLAIVPVLAMIFAIAKGFGFERILEKQLVERLSGQEAVLEKVMTFAHALLENTKGGMIAGIGIIILCWSVIKVMGNIEKSFNDIWEVKKSRNLVRKFTDYLSIVLISPVLLLLSSSATVFITTQITSITEKISVLGLVSPIIFFFLKLVPYGLLWIVFVLLYLLMPNIRVKFSSALVAGIIAGTIYQISQWAYISSQISIAKYNAIYGSFAALPLFLVWLQLGWLVVLVGAEISFAHQNIDTYEYDAVHKKISHRHYQLLCLEITHLIVKTFAAGKKALTAIDITQKLGFPLKSTERFIGDLVESDILSRISSKNNKKIAFQPAVDIRLLAVKYVLDALEKNGHDTLPFNRTAARNTLSNTMEAFGNLIELSCENKLLKDI